MMCGIIEAEWCIIARLVGIWRSFSPDTCRLTRWEEAPSERGKELGATLFYCIAPHFLWTCAVSHLFG